MFNHQSKLPNVAQIEIRGPWDGTSRLGTVLILAPLLEP